MWRPLSTTCQFNECVEPACSLGDAASSVQLTAGSQFPKRRLDRFGIFPSHSSANYPDYSLSKAAIPPSEARAIKTDADFRDADRRESVAWQNATRRDHVTTAQPMACLVSSLCLLTVGLMS